MNEMLISSTQRFIHWDGKQNTVVKRPNAYGLTWDTDTVYYGWNPLDKQVTIIERFGRDLEPQKKLTEGGQWNSHQIYYWKGALYITITAQNKVARYDFKTGNLKTQDLKKGCNNHCNSIFAYKGVIYFLNSNSPTVPVSLSKYTEDLEFIEYFTIQDPGYVFHNLYIEDDVFYGCCHSGKGDRTSNLYRYDLKERKGELFEIRKDTENGFMRGLARNEDYFFIGESQHEPIRSLREMGNSRVLIVDNDMKLIDTIELEDTGQLRDVRLLKGDKAHNGIDF